MKKDLNYYKQNCEEDYVTTPISVLRYITQLEEGHNHAQTEIEELRRDKEELVKMLIKLEPNMRLNSQQEIDDWKKAKQLITKHNG